MAQDYQQLWKDVAGVVDEAKAVQTLAEILADKEGRVFISRLEREDAELCIDILDHGITEHKLEAAENRVFSVTLRRLAEHHERLPRSMMITEKIEVSDEILASGGFADIRSGRYMEQPVAVKTTRITEKANCLKIRKQFCKEVVLWSTLSHPNVLKLIGVQGDMGRGRFITVSEWMAHGNIMEYIKKTHTNRLELLHGAAEGLKYLHEMGLVHGDLKGANILVSDTTPPRVCLADFGFMTMVFNPVHQMSCSAQLEGGTFTFMSPELLVPSNFGMEESIPTPEGDIYAFGMVIFQVLTGEMPFRGVRPTQLGWSVVQGLRPNKPEDASSIGFSDLLWSFVQRCWDGDMKLRPKVTEIVTHLEEAAANWKELMPPSVQTEDVAPDPEEAKSGSVEDCKIFQLSSGVDQEHTTESQTTSGLFSRLDAPSTQRSESPQELQEVVTKPPEELQLEPQVPMQPQFTEPQDGLHVTTSRLQPTPYLPSSQLSQTTWKSVKRFKLILRVLLCFRS